jgi:DNA-directed RNA polymerase specialized sigma24 family protein
MTSWQARSVDLETEAKALSNIVFRQTLSRIPDPLSRAIVSLSVNNLQSQDIADLLILPVEEVERRFDQAKADLRRYGMPSG